MTGQQAIWELGHSSVTAVMVGAVAPQKSDDFRRRGALSAVSGSGLKCVC
jgi:hypothetical protein